MFENNKIKAGEILNIPKPIANSNDQIEVVNHSFLFRNIDNDRQCTGAIVNVRNISRANIGKVVFSTSFYNSEGNILDTIESSLIDFLKGKERVLRIESDKADIRSYFIEIKEAILTPETLATGNDGIVILNHHIQDPDITARGDKRSIDMAIRNVSNKTFATIIFEAIFFDSVGNIMSKTRHREYELKPDISRGIHIVPDKSESDMFKSYKVSIIKALTTDIEKVQLRRHEIRSIEGGEEVRGSVKNLSDVKTDAALVATFKDLTGEKIGTQVIILRDIEPHSAKNFEFTFNPPMGEKVKEYVLNIGELIGEN